MESQARKQELVSLAQDAARKSGLRIGASVAHPSSPLTYELISVYAGIALVGRPSRLHPNQMEKFRRFPLSELFEVEALIRFANLIGTAS